MSKDLFNGKPYLRKVMKKMCVMINVDMNKIKFHSPNWWTTHTWTEKQQEQFRKWFEDLLYNDSKAREELMDLNIKNKKLIGRAVAWFLLCYGWRIKE